MITKHVDITAAFLGTKVNYRIFLCPPPGFWVFSQEARALLNQKCELYQQFRALLFRIELAILAVLMSTFF